MQLVALLADRTTGDEVRITLIIGDLGLPGIRMAALLRSTGTAGDEVGSSDLEH